MLNFRGQTTEMASSSTSVCHFVLLTALATLLWTSAKVSAANHYCIQDSVKIFTMNVDADQPETLRTNHQDVDGVGPWQRCGWEVRLGRMSEPLQLVLWLPEAISALPECRWKMNVELNGTQFKHSWSTEEPPPRGPMIVTVMNSSQQINVQFATEDIPPNSTCGRIQLTIYVVRKGLCGRNMLSFQSRCFFIPHRPLEVADLNGSGAELAAFSGNQQLTDFVIANEQTRHDYPYVKPLDLSVLSRINLILCSETDNPIFRNYSGKWELFNFTDAQRESATRIRSESSAVSHLCGYVQATTINDTHRAELHFGNCSGPSWLLISFSSSPAESV